MVDFIATQARATGVSPSANYEEGQTEAGATKTPSALPSPTIDGVDRMHRQQPEASSQLAECACWRWYVEPDFSLELGRNQSVGACYGALRNNNDMTITN
jgi:hypothetical protein